MARNNGGADKSLARPGSKQARQHVRDARDFNNIETRAVINLYLPLQGKAPKEIHAILTETFSFLVGLRIYQHTCIIILIIIILILFKKSLYRGADNSIAPTRKETSSEAGQGRARFQQHRDAS